MFFFFLFFSFSVAKVDVMEGLLRSSSSSSEKETKCQPHVCVSHCSPVFSEISLFSRSPSENKISPFRSGWRRKSGRRWFVSENFENVILETTQL